MEIDNILPDGYTLHRTEYRDTEFGQALICYFKHKLLPMWKWGITLVDDNTIQLQHGGFCLTLDAVVRDAGVQIDVALPEIVELAKTL